jgi:S1-C subfamily serine protease
MAFAAPRLAQGMEICAPTTALLPVLGSSELMMQIGGVSASQIKALHHYAQTITVTIFVDGDWSSGIIIHQQGSTYTVITNQHVVDFGKHFQVMTSDGRRYQAHLQNHSGFKGNDLALLDFQSAEVSYPVATLTPALSLPPGTLVFAAGFPTAHNSQEFQSHRQPLQPTFHFTSGYISLVSPKVLAGGYQLGYTNPVEKGMSGGPVLNHQGQVIGINGMHAYPLWGNPYVFTDGSRPNPTLYEVMKRSSWAIPVECFLRLAPSHLKSRL